MINKYIYLHDLAETENHAGYKARHDILNVLRERGDIEVVQLPLSIGGVRERISCTVSFIRFLSTLKKDEHVIFNYPLAKPYGNILGVMKTFKSFKISLIVHDLNSLRKKHAEEGSLIYKATNIVSHNKIMTSYIKSIGVEKTNIVDLNLFDYINKCSLEERQPASSSDITLLIAGNLAKEKAGYLYSWEPTYPVDVYGINFIDTSSKLKYHGAFDANNPEKLISLNKLYYGLVWDGDSQLTCSGMFGDYLKYNNPHKASLYLSLSIPIVVWSGSALSEFVRQEQCGIVVDNLGELENILQDRTQWEQYRIAANRLSIKIRTGGFLADALSNFK